MSGGKKSTKSTQKYRPAGYIESGAQQAAGLASQYASQPYTPYTRDRVSEFAPEQEQAAALAVESSGAYQGDLDLAREQFEGVEDFTQFDSQAYMNPYIEGALDPAARELREEGLRRRNDQSGRLDAAGAYGSRAALALREEDELTQQGLSDLYGRGYAEAFDKGAALWSEDQNRAMQQGQNFMQLAGMGSDLVNQDFNRLMQTGEARRQIDQQMKDFDYQQFIEDRDWGGRQAAFMTDVLRGLKGSYSETRTTKSESEESGDILGQVIGAVATIGAAYFSGGASLATGGSSAAVAPEDYGDLGIGLT